MKVLKPVYLIFSEQKFLIEEALTRLKEQMAAQSLGSLNIVEFDWPFDFEELDQALNTVGFLDQRKVVILHQSERLNPSQVKKISHYLKSPNPDVTFVMVALKSNENLFKEAKKGSYFFEYKSPKKGQLAQWVMEKFQKAGKKVNFEVASYLVDSIGNDLVFLSKEIEKISLYNVDKQTLNIADISAVSQNAPHESIFDLVDALGQSNLSLALWYLNNLLAIEVEGKIFRMIVRQFRLLLKAKGLVSEGLNTAQIAKAMGLPPFVVSKYLKQIKHFTISKLINAHNVLLETEVAYKTSGTSFKSALESALIKILAA